MVVEITVSLMLANMVDPCDQVMVDGGDDLAVQSKIALSWKVMVSDDGNNVTRGASREDREEGRKVARERNRVEEKRRRKEDEY